MNPYLIALSVLFYVPSCLGRFGYLYIDREFDGRRALGHALLWPFFALKFLALGLIQAAKELAA